jgi:NDP-sugar pyrophosphorylase family protein
MKAVILAGGLGTRLKPFTSAIPKPLLPVGESTVLETQITNLARHGFRQVFLATNYKSEYIRGFLGDGSRLGVEFFWSKESIPLGTCGPLRLLKKHLTEPFLVLNGDILTLMDFSRFYAFGLKQNVELTVATVRVRTPFNFGSVISKNDRICHIEEKHDLVTECLAGIYFMTPGIFPHIPRNTYFGMDHLILDLLAQRHPIGRYLMKEYWLDIGRIDDYAEAQEAYQRHFRRRKAAARKPAKGKLAALAARPARA